MQGMIAAAFLLSKRANAAWLTGSDFMSTQEVHARFYMENRYDVPKVAQPDTMGWSLLSQPGRYRHNEPAGTSLDLTQPGLYKLFNPMINTTHVIVSGNDPLGALSACSWLTSFGDEDEALTIPQLLDRAGTSKLRLLCNKTIAFTQHVLDIYGYPSRVVRFLTAGPPNGYVEGHVALETYIGGERVLADVSLNYLFQDGSGNRLNAYHAVEEIMADTFVYEPLADDGYAVELAMTAGFDATTYAELFLRTEADRRAWHRDIFNIVGVDNPDDTTDFLLPPGAEDRKAWVEATGQGAWTVIDSEPEFLAKHYPELT